MNRSSQQWSVDQANQLYGVDNWGSGYFGVNNDGELTVKIGGVEVSLLEMVDGMTERDLQMPVLLRIENILDEQISRLNNTFRNAIKKFDYQGVYRGVYPVKVNQQAQVVEEVADFGRRYGHGFEVGSKPEMIAALATLDAEGSLIICNGYKDAEFIDLGLHALKLGFECVFVLEAPTELPIIIERSKALNIEPKIGVRVKMTTQVSGHWNLTSGDRSVFGLNTMQLIDAVDTLRAEGMLHCLQLLHCHLGSQLPNIRDIRSAVQEAGRYYVDLAKEGANLKYIDLGGGLAVDYTGASNSDDQSRNYSLDEYCEDIVDGLKFILDHHQLPHPTIVTESGRATVAYSSILLFNIIDVNNFEASELVPPTENEHRQIRLMRDIYNYLSVERVQECFNDAHFYRQEIRELFKRGQIDLRSRSNAENMFLDLMAKVLELLKNMERIPNDLLELQNSLSDLYYGNFSVFQSLPDIWAIDQLFPIMPIHRLNEEPTRQAVLADITCDCDGKIDRFIDRDDSFSKSLPLHPLKAGEEYYLGVFLVGAYQETLGDLHNLFGDTNIVSVRINNNGSYDFVKEIHGDTIADVLSYVEYEPKEMQLKYRNTAEKAVREGRITARERQAMVKNFNASMNGYTYYERD